MADRVERGEAERERRESGRLLGLPGLIGAPVAAPPGLPMAAEEGDGDGDAGGRGGGDAES